MRSMLVFTQSDEEYASLYTKLAGQGKLIVLADSSPRSL